MNLARIRGEMAKLQALADERERIGKIPLTIFVLPLNGHCPDSELGLPVPRVYWRSHENHYFRKVS